MGTVSITTASDTTSTTTTTGGANLRTTAATAMKHFRWNSRDFMVVAQERGSASFDHYSIIYRMGLGSLPTWWEEFQRLPTTGAKSVDIMDLGGEMLIIFAESQRMGSRAYMASDVLGEPCP